MQKTFIAAALAIAAVAPFAAKADDNNQLKNFYIAGNLGKTDLRADVSHKNSVFQNVRFGWRWNDIVGAEIGYAYLGRPKNETIDGSEGYKIQAATLGVSAKYDFVPNWFIGGHAGYARTRLTSQFDGVRSEPQGSRSTNNGWFGGVSVGYNPTKNSSIALNYDNYRVRDGRAAEKKISANVAAYSVSYEYRF